MQVSIVGTCASHRASLARILTRYVGAGLLLCMEESSTFYTATIHKTVRDKIPLPSLNFFTMLS